jgi:hypothetical protein
MSAHAWWTMACDLRLTERCITRRGAAPSSAATSTDAHRVARELGWHTLRDAAVDVCPACWPDRPRYRAGHLVGGIEPE